MNRYLITSILAAACLGSATGLLAQSPGCPVNYEPVYVDPTPVEDDNYSPPAPPPATTQPDILDFRGIYWVHGLGGGVNSWAQARTATEVGASGFPARKAVGSLVTYPTTSLPAAGLDLVSESALHPLVADPSFNFVIAHSQGGLVARTADQILSNNSQYPRNIHGIVTFGTPHAGAKILDSRESGLTDDFVEETCIALLTGPAFELVEGFPTLLQLFIRPGTVSNTVETICGAGANALPFVLEDLYAGTTDDYHTDSPFLADLNSFDHPDVRKAVFTGVEYAGDENPANPKQLFWRTMSSYDGGGGTTGFFDQDNDDTFVNLANEVTASLEGEYQEWSVYVKMLEDLGCPSTFFFDPCPWGNNNYYNAINKRNAYGRAYEWMLDADKQWKIIIGAYEIGPQNIGSACICESYNDGWISIFVNTEVNNEQECLDYTPYFPDELVNCTWEENYSVITDVYKPSDGIVTEETAAAFPGVTNPIRMERTNHFQMRNSSETKKALTDLYDASSSVIDPWFYTPKK